MGWDVSILAYVLYLLPCFVCEQWRLSLDCSLLITYAIRINLALCLLSHFMRFCVAIVNAPISLEGVRTVHKSHHCSLIIWTQYGCRWSFSYLEGIKVLSLAWYYHQRPYFFSASSEGSDETASSHLLPYREGSAETVHLNRLVWALSVRICHKY